jgi:hypothetical protein
MEIKWTDNDPHTGQRRYLCAERFGGKWTFWYKFQRRGEWTHRLRPKIDTWELVLDALERRYRRREGVSDEDLKQIEDILARLRIKVAAQTDAADADP